jgi:alpha-1,3-rhamnosyl/mannosyltransferase
VGTLEPRKNLSGLLGAFAALHRRIRRPLWLVVAGRRGWERELSVPAEVASQVRFLGVVPDSELPALYSGAALFVSASWYEGFGLPLIEAMACGTLGVVSDLPVFREIGGDACLYADPADPEGFAEQVARGLELAQSGQARERALQQAGQFTWQASALQLLEIYQRVLDSEVSRDGHGA